MRQEEQVRQIRALIDNIDSHTVPQADAVVACPTSSFTDAGQAALERDILFRNHPQLIALSGELPGPGTFLTLNDFGVPILATRDKQGKFRAFLNSCRHRGAQVTQLPRGKQSRFICPYHAWTYGDDGALVKVREEELFGEIDKKCNSLIELPSEEKYGMLWVHPQPDGVLDVDALLGAEFAAELETWELGRSTYQAELNLAGQVNWKLASDTFCEAYHFAVLHSRTVANVVQGDFTTYRTFGEHHCMIVPNKSIKSMLDRPEEKWNIAPVTSVAYYLFPNIHLIINGNVLSVTRIFPDAERPDHSHSRISIYQCDHLLGEWGRALSKMSNEDVYTTDTSAPIVLDVSALVEMFDTTIEQEDYKIAKQMQTTANSGLIDHFKIGRNEPGVQHAHNAIRAKIGMSPLPEYQPEPA